MEDEDCNKFFTKWIMNEIYSLVLSASESLHLDFIYRILNIN
jgi:hypothetical protein